MGAGPSTDAMTDEALFFAVAHGDALLVSELIGRAANVNHIQNDHDGATPCVVAAQEGHLDCLRLLLAQTECEFNRTDRWGFTPCHMAARWGHADCLLELLQKGANPSIKSADGALPCHVAAQYDQVECLRILLSLPTSTPAQFDCAALYDVAMRNNSEACVEFLEHSEQLVVRASLPEPGVAARADSAISV
ncbi:hypothetical protein AB1Y20_014567 [Prymnesium parvum]|uniref:Uncharacterized protein n=1 Tax=Prymnesium parvum TaxID=97485 RepID=A0AB34IB44_PRYPA